MYIFNGNWKLFPHHTNVFLSLRQNNITDILAIDGCRNSKYVILREVKT